MSLPDRRTLLALFGAGPLAAALPKLNLFVPPVEPEPFVTRQGFGLMPLKEEGASLAYDGGLDLLTQAYSYGLGYVITREELENDPERGERMRLAAAALRKRLRL